MKKIILEREANQQCGDLRAPTMGDLRVPTMGDLRGPNNQRFTGPKQSAIYGPPTIRDLRAPQQSVTYGSAAAPSQV
jgi:hypothetical protein